MARAPAIPLDLPQPGEILDERYQIEEALGAGGFGIVVAAKHVRLGQRVAIKFLLGPFARDPEAQERLVREARAARSIRSEHVARVLDLGHLPDGGPYLVMEYLAGTSLGSLLRARGRLPVSDAVDAVLQAGEPVAEAHALGIVHRDLKPSNLYVIARPDRSLSIKVLDFGLSKAGTPGGKPLTETGYVAGSPQYMAPEQMRSLKHADHRSDLWSMGVILYYLLAGRRPFEGQNVALVWAEILRGPPASLRALAPDVPPALEAAILRCLAIDPESRVQSVAELAEAIAPFGSARGRTSAEYIAKAGRR